MIYLTVGAEELFKLLEVGLLVSTRGAHCFLWYASVGLLCIQVDLPIDLCAFETFISVHASFQI